MKPGLYRLTRDVTNPSPDRRSKEFAKRPVWKNGLRLVGVYRRPDFIPDAPKDGGVDFVYPLGAYEMSGIGHRTPGFEQLLAAMEPEPKSLDYVLRRAPGLRGVLERLLAAGKVTLDDVEQAVRKDQR